MDEGDTTETNIDNNTIVGKNTVWAMVELCHYICW